MCGNWCKGSTNTSLTTIFINNLLHGLRPRILYSINFNAFVNLLMGHYTSRTAEMPAKTSRDISRIERFGDNIVGAYMKSKKPPPDVWLVFASSGETPEYAV